MGMHFGILAANAPWSSFLATLSRHTGDFVAKGPVADLESEDLTPQDGGFPLVAGDYHGNSFILDTSFMLSMSSQDFLVQISRETGLLVVGCGAETVSGSFAFFATRAGEPIRLYYNCHMNLSCGLECGDPLPTEPSNPLEDLDGDGMIAALKHFGFDYEGWSAQGSRTRYLYTARELHEANANRGIFSKGPIHELVERHTAAHKLARKDVPKFRVVVREGKTRPVEGVHDAGADALGRPAPKRSWLRRLFGRGP